MHGPQESALVAHAVGIDRDALAADHPVDPFALIGAAVGKGDLAQSVRLALGELALIDRAVGKPRHALAPDLAIDPFAGVFIAVGQPVGAGAMLQPAAEGALVDAADIVLGGQHLTVLRHRLSGQCQRGCNRQCRTKMFHRKSCLPLVPRRPREAIRN